MLTSNVFVCSVGGCCTSSLIIFQYQHMGDIIIQVFSMDNGYVMTR
jgi:hypothetical protein